MDEIDAYIADTPLGSLDWKLEAFQNPKHQSKRRFLLAHQPAPGVKLSVFCHKLSVFCHNFPYFSTCRKRRKAKKIRGIFRKHHTPKIDTEFLLCTIKKNVSHHRLHTFLWGVQIKKEEGARSLHFFANQNISKVALLLIIVHLQIHHPSSFVFPFTTPPPKTSSQLNRSIKSTDSCSISETRPLLTICAVREATNNKAAKSRKQASESLNLKTWT